MREYDGDRLRMLAFQESLRQSAHDKGKIVRGDTGRKLGF